METPKDLRKLTIKSLDIPRLLQFFKGTKNLRTLQLEVSPILSWFESYSIFSVGDILDTFGSIDELILGPVAWYLWRRAFPPCLNIANRMCSRRITVKLPPENFNDIALVSNVLKMCARSCEVHLIFYSDVAEMEKEEIITKLLTLSLVSDGRGVLLKN
ncbi:F-box/LRR-repeat protein [Carex littledalei]|uniref:F-box/LRR-repeat protein n=1 Tax=Carex littledalei TaxID=544730 RepID=A0A833VKA5_9POAL|nr:F-box/LRR-repeat protein [Carex littledalei]